MVMCIAGPLIGITNGAFLMNTFKRISAIVSIAAILGLSGCFFGRGGGWNGHHYHDGDRGSEHYNH
jgi:hypothetical protein